MPDPSDLFDLYGSDDAVARARADAMARRAQALQGTGMILRTLAGDRDPTGGALSQMGTHESDLLTQAITQRPAVQQGELAAHKGLAEEKAWQDPAARGLLTGVVRQFMPNLPLTGEEPIQVLRNVAPMAEKYGSSILALNARAALHGLQQKWDPVTKQSHLFDPISGATYNLDGTPRTPPVRGFPTINGPTAPGGPQPPGPLQPPRNRSLGSPAGSEAPEVTTDPRAGKYADSLKKDLDAASASSRSTFGSAGNIIFRGARIMPLLTQKNPDGTPRQPTTQEWQDISAALVAMQTNGVPPEQMTLNAMPRDVAGNASTMMSWLMSKPYAPDRQEWVKRFSDNIMREEEAAKQQIRTAQLQRIGTHSDYATNFPKRMKQDLRSYGLDPSYVDQIRSGKYQAPTGGGAGPRPGPGPTTDPLGIR